MGAGRTRGCSKAEEPSWCSLPSDARAREQNLKVMKTAYTSQASRRFIPRMFLGDRGACTGLLLCREGSSSPRRVLLSRCVSKRRCRTANVFGLAAWREGCLFAFGRVGWPWARQSSRRPPSRRPPAPVRPSGRVSARGVGRNVRYKVQSGQK